MSWIAGSRSGTVSRSYPGSGLAFKVQLQSALFRLGFRFRYHRAKFADRSVLQAGPGSMGTCTSSQGVYISGSFTDDGDVSGSEGFSCFLSLQGLGFSVQYSICECHALHGCHSNLLCPVPILSDAFTAFRLLLSICLASTEASTENKTDPKAISVIRSRRNSSRSTSDRTRSRRRRRRREEEEEQE